MPSINEFAEIRELILKNAIFNVILINVISGKNEFAVASTLKVLHPQTKQILSNDKLRKKKLPTYVLYDIIIKIQNSEFFIGLKYAEHTTIWELSFKSPVSTKSIKDVSNLVYSKYSVNPAKLDKIFATVSNDFTNFLSLNDYSANFWRLGFSKKLAKSTSEIKEDAITEYYNHLNGRLSLYRSFNNILIRVLKKGVYSFNKDYFGSLLIKKSIYKNKLYVQFESTADFKTYNEILPICVFTPSLWNTIDSNIDLFVLVELT